MPYSNIPQVQTANTFDQWRLRTNSLINVANELVVGAFTKEEGSLTVANGQVIISKNTGTGLSVASDATVSGTLTASGLTVSNTVAFANVNVTGTVNANSFITSAGLNVTNQANAAYGQANTAYGQANTAYAQANSAFGAANSAANTVRVSANSGSTITKANGLNFINTASVTVSVAAGVNGNANVSFTATGSSPADAYAQANNAYGAANSAANTVRVSANSGSTITKANGINFINTASVLVSVVSGVNGNANVSFTTSAVDAYNQANAAYTTANTANTTANAALPAAGGTITGDLTVNANTILKGNIFDLPVITITSDATFGDNAAGKIILANSSSRINVTFATASIGNSAITVVRKGTGVVTIANTSGLARLNTSTYTSMNLKNRYSTATVIYSGLNEIIVIGEF